MEMLDPNILYASLIWGAIGAGLLAWGRKQARFAAIVGGVSLLALTFFITSAGALSFFGMCTVGAVWLSNRYGY